MIIFAMMIILAFRFSFQSIKIDLDIVAPAILWITFLFMGMYALTSSFGKEKDRETLSGLLLCPASRSSLYLGKVIANFVIMLIMEFVALIIFTAFFGYNFPNTFPLLVIVIILGTFGFISVGTLISAMAANTKSREILLPILMIALVILPLIQPAIIATSDILTGGDIEKIIDNMRILGAVAIIYFIACLFAFEYVIEE